MSAATKYYKSTNDTINGLNKEIIELKTKFSLFQLKSQQNTTGIVQPGRLTLLLANSTSSLDNPYNDCQKEYYTEEDEVSNLKNSDKLVKKLSNNKNNKNN